MRGKIDFYKGYTLCLQNAINHLKIAELSKSVSYGIAHAHLVLASEEATKAIMLFNVSFDESVLIEFNDFDEYFSSHKFKHETMRNTEHIMQLLEEMIMIKWSPFFETKFDDLTDDQIVNKRKEGNEKLIKWMEDLADKNKPEVILKTNDSWWKQAEAYKKEGFYVDLQKKQGNWNGPHKCTEHKYYRGKKIVEELISKIEKMEEYSKNDEITRLYSNAKNKP